MPLVTSMRMRSGLMISIPTRTGGDSRPMMTIKQARPRASPHWRLRCWIFPVIWSGLPWALWTTPSKGFKGPHWARYCHHTENPMQVTEAPVSMRPRTGMPLRLSWPVMVVLQRIQQGSPWSQVTPLTVLLYVRVSLGVLLRLRQFQYLSSRRSVGTGARLLAEKALENWMGGAVGDEVSFLSAEEAAWWSSIHLSAGRAVERRIFIVLLVEVASGSGRRRLSGCNGRSGNS